MAVSYKKLWKLLIDKDMKNTDRLDRLTKHVTTSDIGTLFSPSFGTDLPTIHFSRENDNLWILDNKRPESRRNKVLFIMYNK